VSVSILSPDPTIITFNAGTPSATYSPVATATGIVASVNYGEFNGSPLSALKIGGVGFTQLCTVNDATGNSMFFRNLVDARGQHSGRIGAYSCHYPDRGTWQICRSRCVRWRLEQLPECTNTSHNGTVRILRRRCLATSGTDCCGRVFGSRRHFHRSLGQLVYPGCGRSFAKLAMARLDCA